MLLQNPEACSSGKPLRILFVSFQVTEPTSSWRHSRGSTHDLLWKAVRAKQNKVHHLGPITIWSGHYELGNFMRTLALPKEEVERRTLTTPREKLVKIGAKVEPFQ